MKHFTFFLFLFLIFGHNTVAQDSDWTSLIKDQKFSNFNVLNGKASYQLEDEQIIVGITQMNTPNTFLATRDTYSDFILEVEVWVDNAVNSGIQIRSNSFEEYQNGRVHGYQIEIDPSPRAFSGGVYDEGRREWMYPVSLNDKGRSAFRPGEWNSYHIEAIDQHIRVWVNEIMVSNLVDDLTAEGFIAFQVHSIYDKQHEGRKVKWKNPKIVTNNFQKYQWAIDPEVHEESFLINQLTDQEIRKGWRLLFDGKSGKGWYSDNTGSFPDGWVVKNGELQVEARGGNESAGPGDLITTERFSDFELVLEFQLFEGGNSGIKYYVQPELNKGSGSEIGLEFQILDDRNHPDSKEGVNANRTLGSLYDLITAENLSTDNRDKQFKGLGVWNKARIISKNGKVEHWLNGEKIVEYDRHSQVFKALVAYSKYKNWENFGQWSDGHILLQEHGYPVKFRSIKIREF